MAKAISLLLLVLCITSITISKKKKRPSLDIQRTDIINGPCAVEQPHITFNDYFGISASGVPGWTVSVVSKTDCQSSELKLVLSDGTSIAPVINNLYVNDEKSYLGIAFFFNIPFATPATSWKVVYIGSSSATRLGPFNLPKGRPTRSFKPSKWAVVADMDASQYSKSTFDRLNLLAEQDFEGVIHNGDFAYNVHTSKGQVGDIYFNEFSKISSKLPYLITPGNHEKFDHFKMFNYRFQMPGAKNGLSTPRAANYFSFILNGVYFATINWDFVYEDGEDRSKEVIAWFTADLERQSRNQEVRYKVFFSHKPFYCPFTEEDCLQYYLFKPVESLLFKYNFDLVLNSHVHLYYRLKQIDKSFNIVKLDARKPQFFISGHQGVDPAVGGNTDVVSDKRKGVLEVKAIAGEPNYLVVDFRSDSIALTLKDCLSDKIVDSVVLPKTTLQTT